MERKAEWAHRGGRELKAHGRSWAGQPGWINNQPTCSTSTADLFLSSKRFSWNPQFENKLSFCFLNSSVPGRASKSSGFKSKWDCGGCVVIVPVPLLWSLGGGGGGGGVFGERAQPGSLLWQSLCWCLLSACNCYSAAVSSGCLEELAQVMDTKIPPCMLAFAGIELWQERCISLQTHK